MARVRELTIHNFTLTDLDYFIKMYRGTSIRAEYLDGKWHAAACSCTATGDSLSLAIMALRDKIIESSRLPWHEKG